MTVARYLKIDDLPCLDPEPLYEDNHRIGAPIEFYGRANSFRSEIGKKPGVAWILVPKTTNDVIAGTNKNDLHRITWKDSANPFGDTEFENLVLVQSTCMGLDGDHKAPYLLELRDIRQMLQGSGGVTSRYNISDAMPVGTYSTLKRFVPATLNGGFRWTWQEMFEEIWGDLPAIAGAAPSLPWTPPHDPENWRFNGQNAWDAIHLILDACQSAILCDPYTGELSVIALGDPQNGLAAKIDALRDDRLIDWQAAELLARAHWPETVRVMFRGRVRTPNSVEQLDLAWQEWRSIDNPTGLADAESGRVVTVHSDLFDERDNESNTLNQTDLDATALAITERVTARSSVSGEAFRAEYPGIVTSVELGTQIHRIVWRDYGDDDGTRTELWGLVEWGDATHALTPRSKHSTRLAIIKLSQQFWSHSVITGWAYMPDCKVVRYITIGDSYDDNSANETDVILWHPTGYAGNPSTYGSQVRSLHKATGLWPCKHGNNDFVWATWDEVSERWELLAPYEDHWRFELRDDIPVGGFGSAYLRLFSGLTWITTSLVFDVFDSSELGPFLAGTKGVAKRYGDSGVFEILTSTPVARNIWYDAEIVEALCPDNRGSVAVTDVKSLDGPASDAELAAITTAINHYGRSTLAGERILIRRIFTPGASAGSGSGSSGSGSDETFYIVQLTPKCFDIPVALETSCADGSGSESASGSDEFGNGRFLFIDDCGSDSGSLSAGGGGGGESASGSSGGGCSPIRASVQRKVAIETCVEAPELLDQLDLEMFDGVANLNMDGCPTWVNYVHCGFKSCLPETSETAECEEVCPVDSGSASGS
jgi:hypothetical protein